MVPFNKIFSSPVLLLSFDEFNDKLNFVFSTKNKTTISTYNAQDNEFPKPEYMEILQQNIANFELDVRNYQIINISAR